MNMFLLPVGEEDCGLSCLSGDGCAEVCGYFFVNTSARLSLCAKKGKDEKGDIVFMLALLRDPSGKGHPSGQDVCAPAEHLGLIYKTFDVCTQDGYRIRMWLSLLVHGYKSLCV